MDNISDLIPFIIIIGSIVYSIVKNIGKVKQEETAKTTLPGKKEVPLPDTFWDEPEVQEQSAQKEEKKQNVSMPAPARTSSYKVITTAAKNELDLLLVEEEEKSFTLNIDDSDELKKAFIYTEILNRKEL